MSKKTITADGTTFLYQSDLEDTEVVLKVAADAALGGGTLTVTSRHRSIAAPGETIVFDAALAAASQYVISLGKENILEAVLSGATSPDIDITTDPL